MVPNLPPDQRAQLLLKLHREPKILILANVWNPIGARVLEARGHAAIATASAAISASLGYADGERIRRSTMLDMLRRITDATNLPVTADIESGYGESLEELGNTIELVMDCGVVGINLEDGRNDGVELREVEEQCRRIAKAREVATAKGIQLVINARIDCLMSPTMDRETALKIAIERAAAYVAAGADCVYPIGPADVPTVQRLRDGIDAPINILGQPGGAALRELEAIGVNRVSFGPYLFRSALQHFAAAADELAAVGGYDRIANMFTRAEAEEFLRDGRE